MKCVTFRLGTEVYGLPVDAVRSIERLAKIRAVPCSPPHVLGIMNLRGVVTSVSDLHTVFSMEKCEQTEESRLLILADTAFLIDEALDVLDVNVEDIRAQEGQPEVISGVLQHSKDLIAILSPEQLVEQL
ncbi:chemotaxis protein CheW [Ferroacidibacillus organovorans]|uniref:CheW-like domain-containing protein n=1 Tax=Ferroacidibacillus organovorans TaxID=1765683 RepID=A0A162TCP4_9BACL|nr:chemotaxis protein CheW [Ferroacidibacillus organovorans]KYP80672.1 hypothetical protein AYJ22_10250 [Ferroacidibacillus organovorans]OAG93271.1 hypothetical protein AYW79_11405 [Ferroacidibacillus organovorans]OPG15914.1 hypothetical protein B2M26_09960 [Ferroacidibacillus organovorans]